MVSRAEFEDGVLINVEQALISADEVGIDFDQAGIDFGSGWDQV